MILVLKILRIILLLATLLLGIPVIIWLYKNEPATFGDYLNFYALYLLLCTGIILFLIERYFFIQHKRLTRFSCTGLSVLLWIVIVVPLLQKSLTDEATTKIKAGGATSFGRVLFDFKTNNRFRLIEGNGLEAKLYYGSYTMKTDTVCISCPVFMKEHSTFPEYGVLKGDSLFWKNGDVMTIDTAR
ncbi:MAG: hypothetical protein JST86_17045 [Bacteroidetes bacterium]|nr:hypothetical protein [Bacteroidota bacterium]